MSKMGGEVAHVPELTARWWSFTRRVSPDGYFDWDSDATGPARSPFKVA